MQGFGVGCLILGYCAWYTLFQKTWGDGTGYLFNLTGSTRFQATSTTSTTGSPGGQKGNGFTGLGKGGGGDQTGAPQGLGK